MISPLAYLRIGAGIAALIFFGWCATALIDHGRMQERAKAATAARSQDRAADAAERDVLNCPPGKWNRETDKCETR